MMTTLFAFVFANNMVFKKDRERFASSFDSRESFEDFWLSGKWSKGSVASKLTMEALDVFDPLGINGPLPGQRSSSSTDRDESKPEAEVGGAC